MRRSAFSRIKTARARLQSRADLLHRAVLLHTLILIGYYSLQILRWSKGSWFLEAVGFVIPWLFLPTLVFLPTGIYRRSRLLIGLAAVPAVLYLINYGHLYLPNGSTDHDTNTFKVMTYNIHYRNRNIGEIAATIESFGPDLVGIHELLGPAAEPLTQRLMTNYPYQMIGSAIGLFSRYPLHDCENFRMGFGTGYHAQRCVIELYERSITVFNVHPRSPYLPGEDTAHLPFGQLQTIDVQDLLERIGQDNSSLLVIGDFNMSDQQSIYGQLTHKLKDAHVESGWGQGFTFTGSPNLDIAVWRIDYILHSPDLVSLNTRTGKSGNSDHRPLISTLAFR